MPFMPAVTPAVRSSESLVAPGCEGSEGAAPEGVRVLGWIPTQGTNGAADHLAAREGCTMLATLLLVEDELEIRTMLKLSLEDEGYVVHEAADGASGLAAFHQYRPDLVLLDLRLPDRRGLDVCRDIRLASTVPIIIVTAQADTHDLVAGLEAGADDYVTKPVVPKALAARIRALLRRVAMAEPAAGAPGSPGAGTAPPTIRFGPLELREAEAVVIRRGEQLELTKTEFRLLCELAAQPNIVLSRDQLLERVWGYDYLGDTRLVDAHVHRLRNKVEDDPQRPTLILTVRGIGYKLVRPGP